LIIWNNSFEALQIDAKISHQDLQKPHIRKLFKELGVDTDSSGSPQKVYKKVPLSEEDKIHLKEYSSLTGYERVDVNDVVYCTASRAAAKKYDSSWIRYMKNAEPVYGRIRAIILHNKEVVFLVNVVIARKSGRRNGYCKT